MNIKERIREIELALPALGIALTKRETPWTAKLVAGIAVAYALSPIDLIPDFIPVLGYLDDAIILPALIVLAVKLIPDALMEECRRDAENMWSEGKPKRWFYSIPIVIIWVVFLALVFLLFWHKS